ncbi:MAG: extracellular solute-binding protein [Methyloceanibacter sp.]|nr:extracellular solute-binding protein [Methyloceanibacter sp.]
MAGAFGRRGALAAALAAGFSGSAGALAEDTLNIATWGGAYGQSQEIAFFEPFAKETGTRIATEIYDGTLVKIKELIGGDDSAIDVVDVSAATLNALCNEGLLEAISPSSLGAAPSGESAEQDFFAGGLSPCGVASVAWSTAVAFDRRAFSKASPSQIADLLDAKRFPGKRALPNSPRQTLELALLADGVDPANVYGELATQAGADRAFQALDKIKGEIFWWDRAEEPMTWLQEKKVTMAAGYSGRLFRALIGDRQRFAVIWDGQVYDLDLWAIPKSAKNKDGALRFITFATEPARLALQAQLIAYGPMRKSALPLVGKHPAIDVEMTAFLPTAPDNFKKALKFDDAWWNTNGAGLQQRFEAWRGPLAPGQGKPPVVEAKPQEAEAAPAATQATP